jgi:ubiquitin C-terminal hydrolase
MTPYRLPPILIFHLKRFKNQKERMRYMCGGTYTKNDTFVQFPLEGLDMSSYVPDNGTIGGKPVIYDCFGVVNHMGGRGGGHYTAFCKHPKREEWCLYDDSRFTSPIDPSRVPNDCAYVVFYRLREY